MYSYHMYYNILTLLEAETDFHKFIFLYQYFGFDVTKSLNRIHMLLIRCDIMK